MKSLGWAKIQYDRCPYKKSIFIHRHACIERELHVKMKVGNQVIFLHPKEHQRLPANHQRLGERHRTGSSSQPSEGTNLANTLILGFYHPEL